MPVVPKEKNMSPSEDPTLDNASVSDHKSFMKAVVHSCDSSAPKGLLGSVCEHAGGGQPYLAQGCSMQQYCRNQTQRSM